jgi:two-component system C4-dicarboxylate transport sensor histidine kinase DctB
VSDFVPVTPDEERAWLFGLAELADCFGPVSHDLHNLFNALVLQAAVLLREAPEALHPKVSTLRKIALQASELVGRLDEKRHALTPPLRAVDLTAALADAAARLEARGVTVERAFGPDPLPVQGVGCELVRLAELLASAGDAAARAQGKAGPVTLRAESEDGRVLLHVEDVGPAVAEEALADVFEPFATPREGVGPLQLAACQVIARRLGAEIRAAARGKRGVRVTVELQPA